MYELFTGMLPSPNAPPMAQIDSKITPELENLVNKCLAVDPNERPQSVEQVRTTLLLAMKGQHIDEEKVNRAGEGLAAIQQKFGLLDVMQEDKFGAVYLYEDKSSHKLLVIKKRSSTFTGFREAKMLHSLKHPNLVNILGTSKNDSMFIVVMEYVSGGCLQDRLIEPLGMQMFLSIAVQICRGLSFAHQNRICHGNLRPSNILLSSDFQVKITDFGLDEHYRLKADDRNWYSDMDDRRDELSDVFSLGAIFYHALTGVPAAFKDGNLVKTQTFVKLPKDIQQLVIRMLSKRREQRPQSVESVLSELLPLQEEEKTKVIEAPKEEQAVIQKETVIEYQRVNWLTILLAVLMVVSVVLNVLLLSENGEDIRAAIMSFLEHYI
jgi:serine/threonine-protein kinase